MDLGTRGGMPSMSCFTDMHVPLDIVRFGEVPATKICGVVFVEGQHPSVCELNWHPEGLGLLICDQMRNKWCVVYMAFDCSNNPSFSAGEPFPFLLL